MKTSSQKYYSIDPRVEWQRLTKDAYHRLEFDTTLYFLNKYLPKNGLVLDAGGGPGKYTVTLAKKGYKVVLSDLAPENLKFAKKIVKKERVEKNIIAINNDSITDLSRYPNNSFDAVLCLGGPLSHVSSHAKRAKAVKELCRVAKKGAPVFVSVIGKLGTIIRTPIGWPEELLPQGYIQKVATSGDDYKWRRKYFAHYFTLNELGDLVSKTNLKVIERVGLEGLSNPSEWAINKLAKNKKAWRNWLDTHYKLCTHSSVVDTSSHFMIIARK